MSREPWYESDDPGRVARGAGWRFGVGILVVLLVIALISIGVWGFKVVTSDVKGQGDATVQKNSANNRIAAQARFEDLYADIKATDAKLDAARDKAEANPKSQVAQTEFTGLQNYCLDVVADYNAEARKYLAEQFRAIDLPAQIDTQVPETDCKPTPKEQ